ncbi:hypothetical protein [Rhodohalobacter barkolensis]|uniref:Uncharacterized protein n=1 Tax=Rhodohalobacter barkolensis TaxID=2053187 RepID=A0A2N0VIQ4_9BACT|nr:hypothetical protein [Rhodohalobacter barkolensis]PKD44085.1 hypothetical protein CWD77_01025 [Rhodohalobacter barkolensis]
MKSSRRRELEKRREKKQKLQKISDYCKQHVIPWLEIYRELKRNKASFKLEYLASSLDQPLDFLEETLITLLNNEEADLISGIISTSELPVHHSMEKYFPSRQQLRYVPGNTSVTFGSDSIKMVQKAVKELRISKEELCFVCYPIFTPVIFMSVGEMVKQCSVLFEPQESVAILSKDYTWIIFKSLEDEWIWIRRNSMK